MTYVICHLTSNDPNDKWPVIWVIWGHLDYLPSLPQGSPTTPFGTSLNTPQQQQVYEELVNANARLLDENAQMGIHLKQLMEEMKELKERLPIA